MDYISFRDINIYSDSLLINCRTIMAKGSKKTAKKTRVVPAKGSNCGTGSRQSVKTKLLKKLGYTPKTLHATKVQGKPGFCTSVRTISK